MFGVKTWSRSGKVEVVMWSHERVDAERVYEGTAVGGEIKQVELFEDSPSGYYVLAVK